MSARGAMITVLATELSNAVRADEAGDGHDIGSGMFGTAVSAWIRKTVDAFMEAQGMKLSPEHRTAALATFSEYFVRNYPGPNTIISDPNWHAPKIFRAALHAIESESQASDAGESNG